MDRFVLPRYRKPKSPAGSAPVVRVSAEIYDELTEVAAAAGLPLSVVASRAIGFALDRLVYANPDGSQYTD